MSTLSASELNQLEVFLSSPAFNRREEMVRLLDWWRHQRHGKLDKTKVFQQVWPEKAYQERDWYLLVSRFGKLVEKYLLWQELQQDDLEAYPFLLRHFRQRQQSAYFERIFKKAKSLRQKRKNYTAHSLFQAYQLEQVYYDYISSHNRKERTNLQQAADQLDQFFIAEKLKQACLAHSRGIANQEAYHIYFLPSIEKTLEKRPELLKVPAIQVYYTCYQAVVARGEEKHFHQLRHAIASYQEGFPTHEIRDIYLLAINYCIRALNRGQERFASEALSLYEQSLDSKYLLEDGYIPESTFSNIVALGLKLQRFDWVDRFIQQKALFLQPKFQTSLPAYSSAKLAYERGQLTMALQLLATVEPHQPFLYMGIKTLQLKAFYELEEWEALDSLLESMRVYLQRHKDLGYHKRHYGLLLRFARKLLQLQPGDQKGRSQLATAVNETPEFREQEWFLRQLEVGN